MVPAELIGQKQRFGGYGTNVIDSVEQEGDD